MRTGKLTCIAAILLAAATPPAASQPVGEFYKGRTIRFIVGSPTGGDYDVWARILARHMGRHIPGTPGFVVENMPGAGQVIATNYLYNLAPKDGSVIGMISRSMPAAAVMGLANIRFEPAKFNWLGSPEVNHLVLYINNDAGISRTADLFEREIVVGGTSSAQGLTVGPLLLKNLLGMKLKVVTGYKSPGEMALAAGRGEVQAFANTIGGPAGARRPWVESGQMRVLFNFEPEPVRGLGVPSVFEHVRTHEQRQVLTFFAGNVLLGRPMLAPPGAPADRVYALRKALAASLQDPELLKEAETSKLEINALSGVQLDRLVADLAATPPSVVKRAEQASQAN
jgi:tripartite-type tricarboxylate transporter receptor subunit TctC